MKASIDDDGYLKLDAQSLVQALPDKVLRDVAKYALFNDLVMSGIIGALVDGLMWADDEQPWWFDQDTFTKLRLKLLPLLPDVTAEAIRHIERQTRRAKAEETRWRDAAWKLWHAWPDRSTRPEMPSWAYEHHEAMTKKQAEAYLRGVEKDLSAAVTPPDERFFVRYELVGRTHLSGPHCWNQAIEQQVEIINIDGVSNATVVSEADLRG